MCSNSQGVYVIEEGRSVEVCFTLYNNNNDDRQRVNLVTESRSTLGMLNIMTVRLFMLMCS